MAVQDLWGEISLTETVRTPVTILREQAALLEKKTENVLQANVKIAASGNGFSASFDIIAPSLDDYSYRVLIIDYPVVMYPVIIQDNVTEEDIKKNTMYRECRDEESFIQVLGEILSHPQVKKVVANLVAQSRENN